MWRSLDDSGVGVGAFSRGWGVRAATVLVVAVLGAILGLVLGSVVLGLVFGVISGLGCVVMGEASMDTGAYKYPEKYF